MSSLKLIHRAAAAVVGPLAGSRFDPDLELFRLASQAEKTGAAWEKAKLNLELFLAAEQLILDEAHGRPVKREALRPDVLAWVEKIKGRTRARPEIHVQRAD